MTWAGSSRKVWQALEISYDEFIQQRAAASPGSRKFIQQVMTRPYLQRNLRRLYCEGCEAFKTRRAGRRKCPIHLAPVEQRREPAISSRSRSFRNGSWRSMTRIGFHPARVRRNEVLSLRAERSPRHQYHALGQEWAFACLRRGLHHLRVVERLVELYYGHTVRNDETIFRKWWPADIHFIRQGHHPVSLRPVARHADGRRFGAAADGVRAMGSCIEE